MNKLFNQLQTVKQRINRAASQAGRVPEDILLLAVSKTQPVEAILEAIQAGQRDFGENYVQEGVEKIKLLGERLLADSIGSPVAPMTTITWHFIGPLQSNKTRVVAENFQWVHTVDRLKIAQRLSEQRPGHLPPLQVCVQVNVSGEASKSGCTPEEALELCRAVTLLPQLQLRGLMTIPAPAEDFTAQREPLAQLRQLSGKLRSQGIALDTLSMGMSHDLEAAIVEGSTLVRIGTAIFGARQTS